MTQVNIFPWHIQDEGGINLRDEMEVQFILRDPAVSRYRGSPDKVVINWGCSQLPEHVRGSTIINRDTAVATSVNKLNTFRAMNGRCNHVPYTTGYATAQAWLQEGHKVVCRAKLTGREGDGMTVVSPDASRNALEGAPAGVREWLATHLPGLLNARVAPREALPEGIRLFTRFIPYTREYRVHVVDGVAINVRRKIDIAVDGVGDFRNVTIYPQQVADEAVKATAAVGLDFAGVDVLWDDRTAWVLETNTAPSIGGLTVPRYAEALRNLIDRKMRT